MSWEYLPSLQQKVRQVPGLAPGEPERCMCTRITAGDLADTLICPLPWRWSPQARAWVHLL